MAINESRHIGIEASSRSPYSRGEYLSKLNGRGGRSLLNKTIWSIDQSVGNIHRRHKSRHHRTRSVLGAANIKPVNDGHTLSNCCRWVWASTMNRKLDPRFGAFTYRANRVALKVSVDLQNNHCVIYLLARLRLRQSPALTKPGCPHDGVPGAGGPRKGWRGLERELEAAGLDSATGATGKQCKFYFVKR